MTWETSDNVLTITRYDGVESRWTFGVLDDTLYLRGIGLGQAPRFVRASD